MKALVSLVMFLGAAVAQANTTGIPYNEVMAMENVAVYNCTKDSKRFHSVQIKTDRIIVVSNDILSAGADSKGIRNFFGSNYFSVALPLDFLTGKASGAVVSFGDYTSSTKFTCFKQD